MRKSCVINVQRLIYTRNFWNMKPLESRDRRIVLGILAFVLLVIIYLFGAQLGPIGLGVDHVFPGIVSSGSYRRVVMNPNRYDAYSAYEILGKRHSDVAQEIARQQIHSDDDYLWLNAAEYLGNLEDPAATPYLIKALRHTAWRADEETRKSLVKLTGQDFGTDFIKWQQWWLATHPDSQIA